MSESGGEESIFTAALAKATPEQRAAFLDDACGSDADLRRRVEALFAAHEQTCGILDMPAAALRPMGGELSLNDSAVGTTLGPYKLLERIGEGGMGVVYMADQLSPLRRRVALKIIKPGLDSSQVIARFEAERQALAMMDHPHIAKVFDAGTTDTGRPYFVMELVRGIPITEYCDQHQLTPRKRLELFVPVCQAVQHAHQKGIIHRDIKPTNVLITLQDGDNPTPKVIDFGIAKATAGQRLTDLTLFTEFRQLIGTPLYMSPEQAEMSTVMDVDTRSDVYSLGVLLYELLTGTTPFDKQRLATAAFDEVRRIIREEEPPRPSTRLSTLGDTLMTVSASRATDPKRLSQTMRGELDWIVMKALDKERSRRYETANGLARDIERYLADEAVEACPPSRVYRLRKTIRRHKASLATAAIVAVVLIAATAISSWEAVRTHRAERETARQRDQAQAEKRRAEDEKRRADQQAAMARAINEFINTHVLMQFNMGVQAAQSGANRGGSLPQPDITVREAVQRAADHLDGSFTQQPLAEAALRCTIGGLMLEGHDSNQAIVQLKRALQLCRQYASPEDEDQTLGTFMALAMAYQLNGHVSDAIPLLEEALPYARKVSGEASDHTMSVEYDLLDDYYEAKRFDLYQSLLQKMMEDDRKFNGGSHMVRLNSGLGSLYAAQGKYAQAVPLKLKGYQWHCEHDGPLDDYTLASLRGLADVYRGAGQYWKAEAALVQAVCQNHMMHFDLPAIGAEHELRRVFDEHAKHPEAGPMFLGGPDGLAAIQNWLDPWRQKFVARAGHGNQQRTSQKLSEIERLRTDIANLLLNQDGVKLEGGDGASLTELAAIQLYLGDDEGYAATAQQIVARFPEDQSFIKLKLLMPVSTETAKGILEQRTPDPIPPSGYGEFCRGMAHYHLREFGEAVRLLALSAAHFQAGKYTQTPGNLAVAADSYRAMAQWQLGHRREAQAALLDARQRLKKLDPQAVGNVPWCIGRIALRQAEISLRAWPATLPAAGSNP